MNSSFCVRASALQLVARCLANASRLAGLLAAVLVVIGVGWPAAASAATPRIDLKVLLLGTSSTEPDYDAWYAALQREGVPFDSIIATGASNQISAATLSDTLSDGTPEGKYDAIIVATGGLPVCPTSGTGACTSGLTASEWSTLETYEMDFNVRQITGDAYPGASYQPDFTYDNGFGLNAPTFSGALDGSTAGTTQVSGTLTADGQKVFPYLQATAPITMDTGTYGYEATPISTTDFDTLVSGPGGSALVGIYTHPDGVEEMVETFDQNSIQLQSLLLRHGLLAWATRGVYFGDQRNYVEMDIDDTFTPDDAWDTTTHSIDYNDADDLRTQVSDIDYAAQWSAANHFRMDQLFNMGGSVAFAADCADGSQTAGCNGTTDTDPVLAEFQKTDPATGKPYADDFGWLSHTYDTPYLDVGCATQNYIEAELNENTNVAAEAPGSTAGTGGLGLTETDDPTVALGAENPHAFVPGNHSGFADLVPGNPATVDEPLLDTDTAGTGGTLAAGTYEYAITDQFTNSATAGQSAANVTAPLTVPADGSVTLTWQAICHASDYIIYRGVEQTGGTYDWTQVGTVSTPFSATLPDSSSADPASTTDVTGGGETEQTFTDSGAAGTAEASGWTPPSTENAIESPWEQNPYFVPALQAVGITSVGDDGSKPYPNPPDDEFGYGVNYTGTEYPADSTFLEGTAQVVPRHPINIYYNASTDEMELDEYQTLYNNTSTCGNTTCTWSDVINQVVSQMFQYMMGNDPRPSYVHQTNIMGSPAAGSEGANGLPPSTYTPPTTTCTAGEPCTAGDGTLYQVLDPLLYEYNQYFNSSAPFLQLTQQAIANLLAEQAAWSPDPTTVPTTGVAASTTVSGYIQGDQVTITNGGTAPLNIPLTGIPAVGSMYGGTQSGWTSAPMGTSTFTSSTTWPASRTVTVQLSPASIVANGASQSTATATVTNSDAFPIVGDTVAFTSADSGEKVGSVTNNGNGTYTAAITSSKTPHQVTVTATDSTVSPTITGQATLTQNIGPVASVKVRLSPSSIVANGSSQSTATATVSDGIGLPISGDHVAFSSSDAGVHINAITDNGNGTYTATLTSSKTVGSPTITATDSSVSPGVAGQATLTQTAGAAANVKLQLSPSSIAASGASHSTATATVTDAQGHPISGDHLSFGSSDGGDKVGPVTSTGNGTYVATITSSTTAHAVTITATDGSVSPSVSAQTTLEQTGSQPTNTALPAISGLAIVGHALSASTGTWTGTQTISYSYQWQRCKSSCVTVSGARKSSYNVGPGDKGTKLRVIITATNAIGNAKATSTEAGSVLTASQARALLIGALVPRGKTAKIEALLKHGGYTFAFSSPGTSTLEISWYQPSSGAHGAKVKHLPLVATITIGLQGGRVTTVKVALTARGRKMLKGAKRVELSGEGALIPPSGSPFSASTPFTLER